MSVTRVGRTCASAVRVGARDGRTVLLSVLALALAMGVGRFAYTPILPLMERQAHLSAGDGASVATANYLGYLLGALSAGLVPHLVPLRRVFRLGILSLVVSLGAMPLAASVPLWLGLRFAAGAASALIFVRTARGAQSALRDRRELIGWVYGGVGAGIAATGMAVLVVDRFGSWREGWWTVAGIAALAAAVLWRIPEAALAEESGSGRRDDAAAPYRGPLVWLAASYFLEGLGYIIAATFLVAALSTGGAPTWLGDGAWVIVGLAAFPSCFLWITMAKRVPRPLLLTGALAVQAAAVVLPAAFGGTAAALVSALGFGATFMAITQLSLLIGAEAGTPRSVAMLTSVYGLGQVLGPLAVQPLLAHGYRPALAASGAVLLVASICASRVIGRAATTL